MNDRLYRSVDDRVIAGVAGGLADRMGLDPALVRIVWALLILASSGVFLVIYIVMAVVVPEEDDLGGFSPMPPPTAGSNAFGTLGQAGPAGQPPLGAPLGPTGPGWTAPAPTTSQFRAQARAERRAARAARRAQQGPGQGGLVVGVVLILLGAWFLLREYVPSIDFDRLWPFLLLALGVGLLVFSFGGRGGNRGGGGPAGGAGGAA